MDLHELEETAQLARLNLGKEELAAALPAFEQMIGFFAAMQGADNDAAVSETAAPQLSAGQAAGARLVGAEHFRGDAAPGPEVSPVSDPAASAASTADLNEKILNNAGERDGRFIVIPNVL
ncbi:hypothetical protein AGMMS50230_17480 [Spirochaetia bacterium]|nr:hypothetical protein AGMMS50230_17480 [Spirochaetia bacterium]